MNCPFFGLFLPKSCLCTQTVVPLHRLKTYRITFLDLRKEIVMVLGFMVILAVAVFVAEAVKTNNDMNLGLK